MNSSMQDDSDILSEKVKDAPLSEISDSPAETAPQGAAQEEAAPTAEIPPSRGSANLADYLAAARTRARESEMEFKKSLEAIRERDPILAKKTKRIAIAIGVLILLFLAVLLKNILITHENASLSGGKGSGRQIELSEADKLRLAQDANDDLRSRNLTRIAELAAVYHLEQKADLPISATLVKLNEPNPVSDYLRQALSRYGQNADILRDPKDPDFYYAYRSEDGKSIELSARIENENGRYCEYGKSPCIYKATITPAQMQEMNLDLEKYK